LELGSNLGQFAQRLSVMASSSRWLVGVVEVSDEPNPKPLLVLIGKQQRCFHGRGRHQQQGSVVEKGPSAQRERMFVAISHG